MLLKNGAKQTEMDWMGFDEAFPDSKRSVTKGDIQNWIDQNKIEVKEVVKGKVGRRPLKAVSTGTWTFNVVDEETGEVHLRNVSMQSADDYMDNAHDGTNTKFSQYTEPGGQNYKELLLTMPVQGNTITTSEKEELEVLSRRMNNEFNFPKKDLDRYNKLRKKAANSFDNKDQFKSSHYDEPNILAHIRFNERVS